MDGMTDRSEIQYPTELELHQFSKGTLARWRLVELELLASQDEFIADAMEGYTVFRKQRLKKRKLWKGGLTFVGLAMVVFIFLKKEDTERIEHWPVIVKEEVLSENPPKEEPAPVLEEKQKEVHHNVPKKSAYKVQKEYRLDLTVGELPKKGAVYFSIEEAALIPLTVEKRRGERRILWVEGVLFYSTKENNKGTLDYIHTSVAASLENRDSQEESQSANLLEHPFGDVESVPIEYYALSRHLKNDDWASIDDMLSNSERADHNDVNLLFYHALSLYHLGLYDRAEELFLKLKWLCANGFEDDIAYYYALTLYEGSNRDKGVEQLRRISAGDSYYSILAQKKLTE